jgi:ATP-dependent RNA helicase RhlE
LEGLVLPGPIIQETIIDKSFANLGLSAGLLRAVAEQGYTAPTPIQAQAIPVVLSGRDLLGAAQTGTGKTASFTLPLLQKLEPHANASTSPARHAVRGLVLVPTRELAAQVHESVCAYGRHLKLRSTAIFGGVGFNPQAGELRRGADIVVATPGRLLDHVQQRTIDLRRVEILVLDEADRMLDMGFIPAIRRILNLLPAKRQNLLFSATFPDEIRRLAASFMSTPATVEVAPRNRPIELISQVVYPVDQTRKRELLAHLVKTNNWHQVLVFTRTKHGANRLAQHLEHDGIDADAIHGNKSQGARTRALKRFKDNGLQVLVATDIAARGLDIEELPHVVNYDMPHVAEDYVHRIGRTGRAGASGEAVSLVSSDERPLLAAIERLIGRRIEQRTADGFAASPPRTAVPRHEHRARQGREPERREPNPRPRQQPHGQPVHRHDRTGSSESTPSGKLHSPHAQPHRGPDGKRRQDPENGRAQEQPSRRHRPDGNRQQNHSAQRRHEPHVPSYGQHRLPAPLNQTRDKDTQLSSERARKQLFPAFFGLFSRKR